MANIFSSLGTIPIMETVQGMLQRQANLKATEVGTQLEQAKLDLLNREQQMQQQYRDAQLKGLMLNPAVNNPQTTSIDDSKSQGLSGLPMAGVVKQLQNERSSLMQSINLASLYPTRENLEAQKSMYAHLSNLDTQITKATDDYNKDLTERLEKVGGAFSQVNSPEALNSAMDLLYGTDRRQAEALERRLPHDLNTGDRLWNESAKNSVGQYVASQLKTKDALTLDNERMKFQQKVLEDEETKRHHQADEKEKNVRLAQDRELGYARIRARQKLHEDTLAAAGIKYDRKEIDSTQKQIDKLATDSKLGDFKAASDFATRIQNKVTDPAQGFTSVSPEDARQLVEQAKRLQQNFRSFGSAGKIQDQHFSDMNSLLDKFEKTVQSFGTGDPILAKDQMLGLTESMKSVYNDRNAEQVKQELQRTKALADRGNFPDAVVPRGNINDLKEAGRAFEVKVEGKPYLAIVPSGKTKKDLTKDDLYEIPQRKPLPSFLPVPE